MRRGGAVAQRQGKSVESGTKSQLEVRPSRGYITPLIGVIYNYAYFGVNNVTRIQ